MTWTLRQRPSIGGTIPHEYLCPVHGRFTAEVSRDDVPDSVACPVDVDLADCDECTVCGGPNCACDDNFCALPSPWSPSSIATKIPLTSFNRGRAEEPPTRNALTTRELAEGMPLSEWRAKRTKLRVEERRRKNREMRR